ncbi:MAG: hypothetical protein WA056_07185 [Gallionella sp.]
MKKVLFWELLQFAFEKKTARERLRYIMLSILFYPFLVREISIGAKSNDSAASSQAGDDIYPLF